MRQLSKAAISRLPAPSTATPVGSLISALVAWPPPRVVQFRAGSGAPIAGEALHTITGYRVTVGGGHRLPVERARSCGHHPDPHVLGVGDHQAARAVHRDRAGV